MILVAFSSDMNTYKLTHQLVQPIERSGNAGKRIYLVLGNEKNVLKHRAVVLAG